MIDSTDSIEKAVLGDEDSPPVRPARKPARAHVRCPTCRVKLSVSPERLGSETKCPKCAKKFILQAQAPSKELKAAKPAKPNKSAKAAKPTKVNGAKDEKTAPAGKPAVVKKTAGPAPASPGGRPPPAETGGVQMTSAMDPIGPSSISDDALIPARPAAKPEPAASAKADGAKADAAKPVKPDVTKSAKAVQSAKAAIIEPGRPPAANAKPGQAGSSGSAASPGSTAAAPSSPGSSAAGSGGPRTKLGRYELINLLGEGSATRVFEAEDTLRKRRVAVKVFQQAFFARGRKSLARFLRRARSVCGLEHPNIATVTQIGCEGGKYYAVMKLIRGESAAGFLKKHGRMTPAGATQVVLETARALAFAHAEHAIHCDVKPANIMLGSGRTVRLTDLGLTRIEDTESGGIGRPVGSPAYLSPEGCRGEAMDPRSDIYSLGATYYALLTGEPPFKAANAQAVMFKHIYDPLPDPRDAAPEIPVGIVDVLNKAMDKDPARRHQTAEEFIADIESVDFSAADVEASRENLVALLKATGSAPPPGRGSVETRPVRRDSVAAFPGKPARPATNAVQRAADDIARLHGSAAAPEEERPSASKPAEGRTAPRSTARPPVPQAAAGPRSTAKPPVAQTSAGPKSVGRAPVPLAGPSASANPRSLGKPPIPLPGGSGHRLTPLKRPQSGGSGRLWVFIGTALAFGIVGVIAMIAFVSNRNEEQNRLSAKNRKEDRKEDPRPAPKKDDVFIPLPDPRDDPLRNPSIKPDPKAPDTKIDTKVPDTKTPDTKVPDTKTPDTKVPDTKVPDTKTPDTKVPETKDTEPTRGSVEPALAELDRLKAQAESEDVRPDDPGNAKLVKELKAYFERHRESGDPRLRRAAGQAQTMAGDLELLVPLRTEYGALAVAVSENAGLNGNKGRLAAALRGLLAFSEKNASASSPKIQLMAKQAKGMADRYDVPPLTGNRVRFDGHTATVWGVAFFPDGSKFASVGMDDSLRVWDIWSGWEAVSVPDAHAGYVSSVAVSPDGKRLLTAGWDGHVKIWDADTGNNVFVLRGHEKPATAAAFLAGGKKAISGSRDGTLRLWDAEAGKPIATIPAHAGGVEAVAAMPDGLRAVSAGRDGMVRLWDPAAKEPEVRRFEGHSGPVKCVAVSPDGKRIASGGADRSVRVWETDTGKELLRLDGHTGRVESVAFTGGEGRGVVSASADKSVRVWDSATGREGPAYKDNTRVAFAVACSPDGRRAVVGGADLTLRMWDLPGFGPKPAEPPPPPRPGASDAASAPGADLFPPSEGAAGPAKSIVYLIDRSAPMDAVADWVRHSLAAALAAPGAPPRFNVVWYGEEDAAALVATGLTGNDEDGRRRMGVHAARQRFAGAGDPKAALKAADMRPEVLHVVAADDFDADLCEALVKKAAGKMKINAVGLSGLGAARNFPNLQRLTEDTKGKFRLLPASALAGGDN